MIVTISESQKEKYSLLANLIESYLVYAIEYPTKTEVCYSWLVDLTPEQEVQRKELQEELNNYRN